MEAFAQNRCRVSVLLLVVVSGLSMMFLACGDSGHSTTNTSSSYFGTQSPGDAWSWTISRDSAGKGTFSATDNTSGKTYSGNVATLSSKFLQLTITATNDSNVIVGTPGATAYALEFPNTAVIVKPAGSNDLPVIGAAQGTCPSPANYNWIKIPNGTWDVSADPAFGTATTTGTSGSPAFAVAPYLLDGTPLSTVNYSGSCSQGVITTANATFGVTPSGVFIGDQGTGGGVVGMLQPSAPIGTNTVLQTGREFRGFVFMTHPPNGPNNLPVDKTQAIWGRTMGDGLISAGEYTDFANGTEDSCPGGDSCATLSLDSEVAPGQFTGTMTDNHWGPRPVTQAVNQVNGKYVVVGFSLEQSGPDPSALFPFILVVMEQ